jgi:hypothetical protein
MIRIILLLAIVGIPLWSPWMDTGGTEQVSDVVFAAFGPMPAACFDPGGVLLQEGIEVRWYPFGRLVSTCGRDFVVWTWGGVKELGGVSKKAEEIQATRTRALTCTEVIARQEARRASSTDSKLSIFTGERATTPDFSIFPEAQNFRSDITKALQGGATFAGKFAVAEWSCGANCAGHAVVDVGSGLVVAYGIPTEYGIEYSLDSAVLVTNPVKNLPQLPQDNYEAETIGLSIARLPREYYQLTTDALSGTQYLVRQCVESSANGYIEVIDDRIGVIQDTAPTP